MAEFTYGFNIKRDKRISPDVLSADNEKYIARLSDFESANHIETRLFAVLTSMKTDDGKTVIKNSLEENDMMTARKILSDMYGIVHYFIISGKNFERVNTIGRFLKTFNKNIKIHFAVREGEDVNGVLDLNAVDSVITVTDDEMNKAKNSLDKAEHLHISDSDSAALYAGAKIAKTAKNKRRNALVMFSDVCELETPVPLDGDGDLYENHTEENEEQTAENAPVNEETAVTPDKSENSAQ